MIPRLALRQKHQLVGRRRDMTGPADHRQTPALLAHFGADIDLTADDRLNPGLGRHGREFQGAEHIGAVGDGHGRHARGRALRDQILDLNRPLGQRVGGVNAQMNEIGVRHGTAFDVTTLGMFP